MAWRPFLLWWRGKDREMYCRCENKGPLFCGSLLLAWTEPHRYLHSRSLAAPLGRDGNISTGEYCWLICCLFTSQSPPTIVLIWPNWAKMASTGVPASSCHCPLTVSFQFNRHAVMSQIHPCPRCHFRCLNKNRIQSDCWSHMVCEKNEKGRKWRFAMSAVKCWSMVTKTCCTLLVEQHTKPVHAGNSFVHCVHIYIYIFVFICIYVRMRISVLQMEGQLHGDERWGRICQFQAGLETGSVGGAAEVQ